MNIDEYETIAFEQRGRVLHVTFNQPDSLNSFFDRSHTELAHVFDTCALHEGTDIVVLTGSGRAFSAGGNIPAMRRLHENPAEMRSTVKEAKRVIRSVLECDKPIIAKVNGDAVGLGATVALFCDVVIANENARIADPHNSVALIAGDGGSIIWPQLIGYGKARHYLLTGEKIMAREAEAMGLIYKAVAPEQLDAEVNAYVDRLLALPAQALRWTKETYTMPLKQLATMMMDTGMAYEALMSASSDHGEAISAFEAKRKPSFTNR